MLFKAFTLISLTCFSTFGLSHNRRSERNLSLEEERAFCNFKMKQNLGVHATHWKKFCNKVQYRFETRCLVNLSLARGVHGVHEAEDCLTQETGLNRAAAFCKYRIKQELGVHAVHWNSSCEKAKYKFEAYCLIDLAIDEGVHGIHNAKECLSED